MTLQLNLLGTRNTPRKISLDPSGCHGRSEIFFVCIFLLGIFVGVRVDLVYHEIMMYFYFLMKRRRLF